MNTILFHNETDLLDLFDPTSVRESQFEEDVLVSLKRLYPSCWVFKFKPLVYYDNAAWRPDIAVIDRSWSYLFIVEVETKNHSLQKHVMGQVMAFRDGEYSEEAIAAISQHVKIDSSRARTLMAHVPRYVAVISNFESVEWTERLRAINVQHISMSLFGSTEKRAVLVKGALKPAERSVGFGQVFVELQTIRLPVSNFWRNGCYRISSAEDGSIAAWNCICRDNFAWLTNESGVITLQDRRFVQFIAQDENRILMRYLHRSSAN